MFLEDFFQLKKALKLGIQACKNQGNSKMLAERASKLEQSLLWIDSLCRLQDAPAPQSLDTKQEPLSPPVTHQAKPDPTSKPGNGLRQIDYNQIPTPDDLFSWFDSDEVEGLEYEINRAKEHQKFPSFMRFMRSSDNPPELDWQFGDPEGDALEDLTDFLQFLGMDKASTLKRAHGSLQASQLLESQNESQSPSRLPSRLPSPVECLASPEASAPTCLAIKDLERETALGGPPATTSVSQQTTLPEMGQTMPVDERPTAITSVQTTSPQVPEQTTMPGGPDQTVGAEPTPASTEQQNIPVQTVAQEQPAPSAEQPSMPEVPAQTVAPAPASSTEQPPMPVVPAQTVASAPAAASTEQPPMPEVPPQTVASAPPAASTQQQTMPEMPEIPLMTAAPAPAERLFWDYAIRPRSIDDLRRFFKKPNTVEFADERMKAIQHPLFRKFLGDTKSSAGMSTWAKQINEKERLQDLRAFMVWAHDHSKSAKASDHVNDAVVRANPTDLETMMAVSERQAQFDTCPPHLALRATPKSRPSPGVDGGDADAVERELKSAAQRCVPPTPPTRVSKKRAVGQQSLEESIVRTQKDGTFFFFFGGGVLSY